jgi:hypothetical protein
MEHVSNIIRGHSEYILLDEQIVVYDKILTCAKKGFHDKQKTVIIVKGGVGTGKSVIAINAMADLLTKGYNAHYATGSRAFTNTLWKIIGARGSVQFKYFNSYTEAEDNVIDVLICDEAHRIRIKSDSRFTPKAKRSDKFQIEEIIKASKVSVYFIDDDQVVRPKEIGSVNYIKEYGEKYKCRIFEYELEAQFRCNGSDAFVNWINNTLGIKKTANAIWENKDFDFKIFESPHAVERTIFEKVNDGNSGRMSAGFCWKWSSPNLDGTLVDDVVISQYIRPWNAKPEAKHLALGIPKAIHWAYDPNGINQVGCVYTAQGFEFDYIGVIFGDDLIFNFEKQNWEGHPENSKDTGLLSELRQQKNTINYSEVYLNIVKRVYRVLLSRGIKGCYVYFLNKSTENFFKSRMEL